jgi:uncharacterized protein (TIGR02145 family)
MGTQQMLSVPYALSASQSEYAQNAQHAENAMNGFSGISETGDTLHFSNGNYIIIPGLSFANSIGTSTGTTLHTCGYPDVHNPNLSYGSLTDQEGNIYKTIVIGTQEWMAENLNTSIYRNGDTIITNLTDLEWFNTLYEETGAWTYYDKNPDYACPHGKLYNWFACDDDRGLCPVGWHVPSREEWQILFWVYNIFQLASTGVWNPDFLFLTNLSGLSLIPSGIGSVSTGDPDLTMFNALGETFRCWTSEGEISGSTNAFYADPNGVRGFQGDIDHGDYKMSGYSVRCLRD